MSKAAVRGDTDQLEERSFADFLADEMSEHGGVDDSEILDGLEEPVEEGEEEQGEEAETGEVETPGDTTGRNLGTDEVLRYLENNLPEGAAAMRGLQQRVGQRENEFQDLKTQMLDVRDQMLAMREGRDAGTAAGEEGQSSPDAPPAVEGISQENLELFRSMASALGYVSKEDLDSRDQEQAVGTLVQQELQQGVELYGDAFGTVGEDGKVVVNPDIQEKLQSRLESLRDPARGVTPLDLYKLEYPEARVQPAAAEGTPKQGARRVGRANVARSSSGGSRRVRIYDPERGDTPEEVMERSWALAKRELSQ